MSDLKNIAQLAKQMLAYEDKVEQAMQRLKELNEDLRDIVERKLPEAMESAEMTEFTLEDGSRVSIKPAYYAHITADHKEEAFAWLRANNLDGLIKNDITLSFGKGDDAAAQEALAVVDGAGWAHKDKQHVHPQTLRAFVKEQLEDGQDIPMEVFGVQRIVRAAVKRAEQ